MELPPEARRQFTELRFSDQITSFSWVLDDIVKFVGIPNAVILNQLVLSASQREGRGRLWKTGFPIVFIQKRFAPGIRCRGFVQ